MDLRPYVTSIGHELAVAAEASGDEARALAERLVAPLTSSIRLALLDILSAAADEITRDLAPGSVELRLRGGEPSFVVSRPPEDHATADAADTPRTGASSPDATFEPPGVEDGATARINLRLPEQLKTRAEEAAAREGRSVNAWLVLAVSSALQPVPQRQTPAPRGQRGAQGYTGWVR